VEITGEQAGVHFCLTVKEIMDRDIVNLAAKANLSLMPLSLFYIGKAVRQGVVLGFVSTGAEQMAEAVQGLRGVVSEAKSNGMKTDSM
jgi:DNA-binding transcriptional MocR family regulator